MRRVREYLPQTAILYITRRTGLTEIADRTLRIEPAEHVGSLAAVAQAELLDGSTEQQVEAAAAESVFDGDAIDALDAIDQVGMESEAAQGTVEVSSRAVQGLAAFDPATAALLGKLQVTAEELHVPSELTDDEARPRVSKIALAFKGTLAAAFALVLLGSLGSIAPDLAFGRVTDAVLDNNGKDPSSAYVWALIVAIIAVGVGFIAKYSRIMVSRFIQSAIVVLRRRVFYRLTKLGVNYYDRELPGDVATRIVADLDRILSFGANSAFRFVIQLVLCVVALGAIIVLAPGVTAVVVIMLGLDPARHRGAAPVRQPRALVVAPGARCGHAQVPGRLRCRATRSVTSVRTRSRRRSSSKRAGSVAVLAGGPSRSRTRTLPSCSSSGR